MRKAFRVKYAAATYENDRVNPTRHSLEHLLERRWCCKIYCELNKRSFDLNWITQLTFPGTLCFCYPWLSYFKC